MVEDDAAVGTTDAAADSYGGPVVDTAAWLKLELVRRHVTPTDRVLDIGCANGLHLRVAASLAASAVGIDRSPAMAAAASRAGGDEGAAVVQAAAGALPVADASIDLAYSFSTLLLVPDLEAAVREVRRVLRSGAIAILDVQNVLNLSLHAWRWWYRRHGQPTLNGLTRRRLRALLRANGLEPISWHATGFTDQWRYVPLLRRATALNRLFHEQVECDRDHRISQSRLLASFANRWYVVARATTAARP